MAQPPYDPYGYGPQDPYAQQPMPVQHHYHGGAPVGPRTNGMAIASMVISLVNLVLAISTCGFFGFLGILSIIFGHLAQSQIKRTGENGSGLAVTGLILGYLGTVALLVMWILIFGIYGWAFWSLDQEYESPNTY